MYLHSSEMQGFLAAYASLLLAVYAGRPQLSGALFSVVVPLNHFGYRGYIYSALHLGIPLNT